MYLQTRGREFPVVLKQRHFSREEERLFHSERLSKSDMVQVCLTLSDGKDLHDELISGVFIMGG